MGAAAHLTTRALAVTPGSQSVAEIRVRNTGTVVDQFTVSVLGEAQPWSTVEPPTLSLFPGAEETARVVFSPPRSPDVPAGETAFAVRVESKEDPAGSVVEEGVLDVAPFVDTYAEIAPRTSRGSRGGSHDIAIDNRGNTRLNAQLVATDPDKALDFDLQPPAIVADPGTAVIGKIKVKPTKRFWRGPPKTHPFRVEVIQPDAPAVGIDGTMLQESMLPPWALRAALMVGALAIAAVLFWVFALQPAINDRIGSAVATQMAEAVDEKVKDALIAAGASTDPAGNPVIPPPGGGGTPTAPPGNGTTPTPTPVSVPTPQPPPTAAPAVPRDGRLLGSNDSEAVPDGSTLFVTDVVFSNPSDALEGEIQLGRSDRPLLVLRLENIRDYDFHFVTPIVIAGGQSLTLTCPTGCAGAAVYWSGYLR